VSRNLIRFATVCAAAFALTAAAAPASAAVQIFASYDGYYADTTSFTIVTDADLTNVNFGASGGVPGAGTWNIADGTVNAGATTLSFSDNGGPFTYDYDDYYQGEENFTFSATYLGQSVTAAFSPSSNQSGGFVGFLGNDVNGNESDFSFEPTLVATAGGVPEPASWALMLGGFGLAGAALRRRRTVAVAA
jgi:hypothetical protein